MKKEIHPEYVESTITCACGAVIHTRSTKKEIRVGVCSSCHPFFTGTQKFVDTAGRVEKFKKKYAKTQKAAKRVRAPKAAQASGTPEAEEQLPPKKDERQPVAESRSAEGAGAPPEQPPRPEHTPDSSGDSPEKGTAPPPAGGESRGAEGGTLKRGEEAGGE